MWLLRNDIEQPKWLYFYNRCIYNISTAGNAFLAAINYRFGHCFVIPSGCKNQLVFSLLLQKKQISRTSASFCCVGLLFIAFSLSLLRIYLVFVWAMQRMNGWTYLQVIMLMRAGTELQFCNYFAWLLCVYVCVCAREMWHIWIIFRRKYLSLCTIIITGTFYPPT